MSNECIIAIDQGTTGSRVFIFDRGGQVIAGEYAEFTQHFPKPAWVEHDPEEIWSGVETLLKKALQKSERNPSDVRGIGITNQRETVVVWDKETGTPIHNAIVWQCRRTSTQCEKLKEEGHEPMIRKKTGLVIDAYFSGTKVAWILENVDGAKEKAKQGRLAMGTIDSWLLFRLTGEHSTDYTNASRTLLYNIEKREWDEDLLNLLGIPTSMLPEVHPSRFCFGKIRDIAGLKGVPVLAMIGDQQAALFGQLRVHPGEAKNTYGTGCFLLFNTGDQFLISDSGLLTTLACNAEGGPAYALEGAVFIAGAVIQWLRDSMKFFAKASDSEDLLKELDDSPDELVFVPAFAGLGAPHWDMNARGAILGLSRDTSPARITRAALKSIALQSYELVQAMENDTKERMNLLRIDGGATSNTFLAQYQADILNKPVERSGNVDATALGSAYLAGMEAGLWDLKTLETFQSDGSRFEPSMDSQRREHELRYWKRAIEKVKGWAE